MLQGMPISVDGVSPQWNGIRCLTRLDGAVPIRVCNHLLKPKPLSLRLVAVATERCILPEKAAFPT